MKVIINPAKKMMIGITTKRELQQQFINLKDYLARQQ